MTANRDLAVCDHGCDMTRLITLLTYMVTGTDHTDHTSTSGAPLSTVLAIGYKI